MGYVYYQFTYFVFYFVMFHTVYAMITLDLPVLFFYMVVSVLQGKVKRSQKYIDWCDKFIQFRKGLKSTKVIYEEAIAEDQQCLFGFHPHGALATCVPVFMNYPTGPFKYSVGLASRAMLNVPFCGLLLRLWGVEGVDAGNMKKLLSEGKNINLVPGGFE